MTIKNHKDAAAGLVFILIGSFAFVYAHAYAIGSALNMGPGFFPALLGVILLLLGLFILARSISATPDRPERIGWRPLLLLPLGVLLFGLMIDRLGLLAAMLAAVLLSRLAAPRFRPVEVLAVCAVLMAMTSVLFVYGLGLPPAALLPR
jgi:hypothetical protein